MNDLVVLTVPGLSWYKIMTKLEAHRFILRHKTMYLIDVQDATWSIGLY